MMGGTIFYASQASSDDFETSEQNPVGDESQLRSSRDPVGYSKGTPDPKHYGQVMRSAMKAEWIKSQTSEMAGLWCRRDTTSQPFRFRKKVNSDELTRQRKWDKQETEEYMRHFNALKLDSLTSVSPLALIAATGNVRKKKNLQMFG